ncbi:hypothetical protein HGP28_14345 [Vibrio sp. SM6]|uniref:Cation transporter n=1 Tax=Vibrio agarilyticus TaxID=2726741 RepID=A0A7X8TSZ0_9VIBR|nr:hypothetical protein [Vibrio agarilyticus]NLS14071.1 hypothetical protein [Vibrio agarilyticus]
MERDNFGICLSKALLSRNRNSTFTHVRAYEKRQIDAEEMMVRHVFPQMTGQDLLQTMCESNHFEWRAEFFCPSEN